MHINYLETKMPKYIKSLFAKYGLATPPLQYVVEEDATTIDYIFKNGLRLSTGLPWCDESNNHKIKEFYDIQP